MEKFSPNNNRCADERGDVNRARGIRRPSRGFVGILGRKEKFNKTAREYTTKYAYL